MNALRLSVLLAGFGARLPDDPLVTGLTLDSREAGTGSLFLARRGHREHGLRHAPDAEARGAAAVVFDPRDAPSVMTRIPQVPLPDLEARLGEIARRFYGEAARPLALTAVTGTNGKTTVAWLLAHAWRALGRRTAYLGTLGLDDGTALAPSDRTTPDVITMHARAAGLARAGVRALVLEASSHALDQGRLDGLEISTGLFTNLSPEHLDYHRTLEHYREAKWRLFARPELRRAVIHTGDETGRLFAERLRGGRAALTAYALDGPADFRAEGVVADSRGTRFVLLGPDGRPRPVLSPLLGRFNVENLLAVAAALHAEGAPPDEAARVLPALAPPPGRLSVVRAPGRPLAVVDFAHTPAALEAVLAVCRGLTPGRLVVVFGCGGERDRLKRPAMGRIAAALADRVVITDDNPRHEDPEAIAREILAGVPGGDARAVVIHDRARAIARALAEAGPEDLVLVAGKGHEESQIYGARQIPFSDLAAVRACLGLEEARC